MVVYRVDPMWGQSCSGYHIQYRFPEAALARISAIQDNVERTVGGLRRVPLASIHMTVITLLHPQTGPAADVLWTRCAQQWVEDVERICASAKPVRLVLDTVRAFDTAIVLMTEQCGELQSLRQELGKELAPSAAAGVPRIAHTSLFRYADLQAAGEHLGALASAEALDVEVSEVVLVRETKYPSLEFEPLRRFRLSD